MLLKLLLTSSIISSIFTREKWKMHFWCDFWYHLQTEITRALHILFSRNYYQIFEKVKKQNKIPLQKITTNGYQKYNKCLKIYLLWSIINMILKIILKIICIIKVFLYKIKHHFIKSKFFIKLNTYLNKLLNTFFCHSQFELLELWKKIQCLFDIITKTISSHSFINRFEIY